MNVRKNILREKPEKKIDFPVFEHLSELVDATLCPRSEGKNYHNKLCCDRQRPNCGVDTFKFLPEEQNTECRHWQNKMAGI